MGSDDVRLMLRGEEAFESLDMETTSRVRGVVLGSCGAFDLNLPNPGVENDGRDIFETFTV
jgi:hypothetical protein